MRRGCSVATWSSSASTTSPNGTDALVLGRAAVQHEHPGVPRALAQRAQQGALPDPGLAEQTQRASAPAPRFLHGPVHAGELRLASQQIHCTRERSPWGCFSTRQSVRRGGVTDAEQLAARSAADPHSYLGAHPDGNGGVVVRAFRPAARGVRVITRDGGRAELASVHPAGVFEGRVAGASLPLDYELEVDYGDDGTFTVGDPYRFLPTLGRHGPAPRRRGPPRGALRQARRARRRRTRACRAPRSRSGRRARARSPWSATSTHGTAGCTRCGRSARAGSGSCSCPASARARTTSTRSSPQTGEIRLKADPVAFATELPPQDGVGRLRVGVRLGRRGVAARAGQDDPARPADLDLRGPSRLVAAEPDGGQPLAHLPGAGRRARGVRARTWASRTSS